MHTFFKRTVLLFLALTFVSTISPLTAMAQGAPMVSVPDHCTAAGVDGATHTYATGQFLGICALLAAKEQGAVSSYQLVYDNTFGFYVQTLNGTIPSSTQYWALYKNNVYADDGLSTMVVARGDQLTFQLTDWSDNSTIGAPVVFTIDTPVSVPAAPTATGGSLTLHAPFDVPLALAFLEKAQRADGSFDSLLLSDWTAIALSVGGAGDAQRKLSRYFAANPPSLQSVSDYERHAMALEALGINPYSGTAIDYIAPIITAFDGAQIGDPGLVNDDIFGLFPLVHAGYTANDGIISQTSAFILSRQKSDGSWEESVDLTAAAIQALSPLHSLSGVNEAIQKAFGYLRSQQKDDSGFGNSFSTSWTLQAIAALDGTVGDWQRGIYTPDYYLATQQARDGGVEATSTSEQTRVWATAYAIPAIKREAWDSLLSPFTKPLPAATSTPIVATSTPTTATSTVELPATNTPASTPAPEPLVKEEAPQIPPPEATTSSPESAVNQTASVANASGGLWSNIWRSITSFFSRLF